MEETEKNKDDCYDIACVSKEGGSASDLDDKIRAVELWKNGKSKQHSLDSVSHKFKKVKSLRQLYRWESINRGGTHKDKLLFITEYVLTTFENNVVDEKTISSHLSSTLGS